MRGWRRSPWLRRACDRCTRKRHRIRWRVRGRSLRNGPAFPRRSPRTSNVPWPRCGAADRRMRKRLHVGATRAESVRVRVRRNSPDPPPHRDPAGSDSWPAARTGPGALPHRSRVRTRRRSGRRATCCRSSTTKRAIHVHPQGSADRVKPGTAHGIARGRVPTRGETRRAIVAMVLRHGLKLAGADAPRASIPRCAGRRLRDEVSL